jgi:hypothetical protein
VIGKIIFFREPEKKLTKPASRKHLHRARFLRSRHDIPRQACKHVLAGRFTNLHKTAVTERIQQKNAKLKTRLTISREIAATYIRGNTLNLPGRERNFERDNNSRRHEYQTSQTSFTSIFDR